MINSKIILWTTCLLVLFFSSLGAEEKTQKLLDSHKYNFYTGTFDFSDDKKSSTVFGLQHQNENLMRETVFGTISPITGFMMTADNATYLYTGIQGEYNFGKLNFNPSFTPGLYGQGDGKDLGKTLEFKSELQLSLDLPKDSSFGLSYNHISNGGLGDKNPGANSYMFNFLKNF